MGVGRAAAYGKVPTAGDFLRLGAPPSGFVAAWDAWLQAGLLDGAARLAEAWDAAYMSAPIWRFSLGAGLAGPVAVAGVMMASVDRVGRRFPLTLLWPRALDGIDGHLGAGAAFARMEAVVLAALEDDMTRDRLDAALRDLPEPVGSPDRPAQLRVLDAPSPDVATAPAIFTALVSDATYLVPAAGLPEGLAFDALWRPEAAAWRDAVVTR